MHNKIKHVKIPPLLTRPVLGEHEPRPWSLIEPVDLLLATQKDASQHQLRHHLGVLHLEWKEEVKQG